MSDTTTSKIAELNDLCRTAMGVAGKLFQTAGIDALPLADQSAIREKVETFDTFTPDNDPHGEQDFGAFEHNGERIFWKIDYYDRDHARTGQRRPERPKANRPRPHHHACIRILTSRGRARARPLFHPHQRCRRPPEISRLLRSISPQSASRLHNLKLLHGTGA